jgi:hypothetical protein
MDCNMPTCFFAGRPLSTVVWQSTAMVIGYAILLAFYGFVYATLFRGFILGPYRFYFVLLVVFLIVFVFGNPLILALVRGVSFMTALRMVTSFQQNISLLQVIVAACGAKVGLYLLGAIGSFILQRILAQARGYNPHEQPEC